MAVRSIPMGDETVDASTFNQFAGLIHGNIYDVPREQLAAFAFSFTAFPELFSCGFPEVTRAMFVRRID